MALELIISFFALGFMPWVLPWVYLNDHCPLPSYHRRQQAYTFALCTQPDLLSVLPFLHFIQTCSASLKVQVGYQEKVLHQRMNGPWNRLPRAVVMAPSYQSSSTVWTLLSYTRSDFYVVLCGARSWLWSTINDPCGSLPTQDILQFLIPWILLVLHVNHHLHSAHCPESEERDGTEHKESCTQRRSHHTGRKHLKSRSKIMSPWVDALDTFTKEKR